MSDPFMPLTRLVAPLFVVVMLVFPLVVALFTPTRVKGDTERATVRMRLLVLGVATLLALVVWAGALAVAARWPGGQLPLLANFAWVFFFPLWFGLAMPVIRAKNVVWAGAFDGTTTVSTPQRSASLVNRARDNPINRVSWIVLAVVVVGMLAAIAVRGLMPFEDVAFAGQGRAKWMQWLVMVGTYTVCALTTLVVVPFSIRRMQEEPEPLDPSGSRELMDLYRSQRRRRTLMLFWMLGVLLPGFLGAVFAAAVWMPPEYGRMFGVVGAIGGSAIGLAGGIFGCLMTLERVRIAEVKARLESAQGGQAM